METNSKINLIMNNKVVLGGENISKQCNTQKILYQRV